MVHHISYQCNSKCKTNIMSNYSVYSMMCIYIYTYEVFMFDCVVYHEIYHTLAGDSLNSPNTIL